MANGATPPFYGDLVAGHVKSAIAPLGVGATNDLIEERLHEAELDVQNEIGALPQPADTIVRSVIRDVAASAVLRKLVGLDNDEGRRAAESLAAEAWTRLERWTENRMSDASSDPSYALHNFTDAPLWNRHRGPLHGLIEDLSAPEGPWTVP